MVFVDEYVAKHIAVYERVPPKGNRPLDPRHTKMNMVFLAVPQWTKRQKLQCLSNTKKRRDLDDIPERFTRSPYPLHFVILLSRLQRPTNTTSWVSP